jgi:hypothetical protein
VADIPFQIGGYELLCPDFSKSKFDELADISYQYLNGSPLYLGMPSITYVWPFLRSDHVATIRAVYGALVTSINLLLPNGTPISLTVPDYKNGGLRTTTAYMLEPTGTAGGDGSANFTVTFTQLHEGALLAALTTGSGNLWDVAANGDNLKIGSAEFSLTGWQF